MIWVHIIHSAVSEVQLFIFKYYTYGGGRQRVRESKREREIHDS